MAVERLAPPTPALEFQLAAARGVAVIGGLAVAGWFALHGDAVQVMGVLAIAWLGELRVRVTLLGGLARVWVGETVRLIGGDRRPVWPGEVDEEGVRAAWFRRSVGLERVEWLLLLTWPDGRAGQLRLRTAEQVAGPEAVPLDEVLSGLAGVAWRTTPAAGGWLVFDDVGGGLLNLVAERVRAPRGVVLGDGVLLDPTGWVGAGEVEQVAWRGEEPARLALRSAQGGLLVLPVAAGGEPEVGGQAMAVHPLAAAWLLHHLAPSVAGGGAGAAVLHASAPKVSSNP